MLSVLVKNLKDFYGREPKILGIIDPIYEEKISKNIPYNYNLVKTSVLDDEDVRKLIKDKEET